MKKKSPEKENQWTLNWRNLVRTRGKAWFELNHPEVYKQVKHLIEKHELEKLKN